MKHTSNEQCYVQFICWGNEVIMSDLTNLSKWMNKQMNDCSGRETRNLLQIVPPPKTPRAKLQLLEDLCEEWPQPPLRLSGPEIIEENPDFEKEYPCRNLDKKARPLALLLSACHQWVYMFAPVQCTHQSHYSILFVISATQTNIGMRSDTQTNGVR